MPYNTSTLNHAYVISTQVSDIGDNDINQDAVFSYPLGQGFWHGPLSHLGKALTSFMYIHLESYFYWNIVYVKCANFCYAAEWFSYTHKNVYIFCFIFIYSSLLLLIPNSPIHLSPTPLPLGHHKSVLYVLQSVSVS